MTTDNRTMLAWAMYDWANSAYATTVMAGFFPIYFKQYWSAGVSVGQSSYYLGIANSGASLIIMLLAPILGAIADQLGARQRLLLLFAFIGILMTASGKRASERPKGRRSLLAHAAFLVL